MITEPIDAVAERGERDVVADIAVSFPFTVIELADTTTTPPESGTHLIMGVGSKTGN